MFEPEPEFLFVTCDAVFSIALKQGISSNLVLHPGRKKEIIFPELNFSIRFEGQYVFNDWVDPESLD